MGMNAPQVGFRQGLGHQRRLVRRQPAVLENGLYETLESLAWDHRVFAAGCMHFFSFQSFAAAVRRVTVQGTPAL
jgi:hypothetical protein